jgi:hypothetical protein
MSKYKKINNEYESDDNNYIGEKLVKLIHKIFI